MEIAIANSELYNLIKEAVREVIHEERLDIFLKNIQKISKEEMEDIEKLYGEPSNKKKIAYDEIIEI